MPLSIRFQKNCFPLSLFNSKLELFESSNRKCPWCREIPCQDHYFSSGRFIWCRTSRDLVSSTETGTVCLHRKGPPLTESSTHRVLLNLTTVLSKSGVGPLRSHSHWVTFPYLVCDPGYIRVPVLSFAMVDVKHPTAFRSSR